MRDFEDKVAVITGAGRGIGRGIALRCAAEGMRVVLAGIGLDSLTSTEADLKKLGAVTKIVQTDVRKVDEIENLAEITLSTFGEAHLLVNNAGVGVYHSVWENSLADWEWVMGVNFWGVLYGIQAFVPIMMKQSAQCHIVNVSSLNGVYPGQPALGSYSASKHAVVSLTESLYYELSETAPHIAVSVYIPGGVDTDIPDAERNRPDELKNEHDVSNEQRERTKALRNHLAAGKTIEEAADILFKGLRENKLYIGVQGYLDQIPNLVDIIQSRTTKIIDQSD